MRILQITPELTGNSGIHHVSMNYLREFDKSVKYDFLYFGKSQKEMIEEIESLGCRTYKVSSPLNFRSFLKDWNKFCDKHYGEFDILENNLPFLNGFFRKSKEELGVKLVIAHAHATKFGDSKLSNIRNKIFYEITGKNVPDILFGCTREAIESIFGNVNNALPSYKVRNAFDVNKYRFNDKVREDIRNELNWNGKRVIGHIGRFSPPKNHEFILKIFKSCLKLSDKYVLVLVGEGELKERIEREASKEGIRNKIQFLGYQPDISKIIQGFDVFLFPSVFEGLGISAVEAQCCGLPVVVSENVPNDALITNYSVLCLNDDPQIWAKKIDGVQGNFSKEGLSKVIESGYDIKEAAPSLERLYFNLVRD
ncbi:glycosyltransferase [Limosilactobacillus ingluviei]